MASPLATSSAFSSGNSANTRVAGAELNGNLASIGLVQTADTGQVNWTTATVVAGASIGYEIWHSSDSSFYFKLEWQSPSANTTGTAGFFLTVGTGSDGAGTITGIFFPRTAIAAGSTTAANTTGAKASYFSHTADYLGVVYKVGGSPTTPSILAFAIEKMVDTSGAASSTGFVVSYMGAGGTALMIKRALRTAATAADYGVTTSFCVVPSDMTNSTVGADRQIFLHAQPSPRCIFSNFLCTVITAELSIGTTFAATLVGTTSHTYIAIANSMGCGNSGNATTTWGCAMRWE